MKVLVACELSGTVRDAFRARGHDAWSCDLMPTDADEKWHLVGDALDCIQSPTFGEPWDLMIAHPPCTYLTCTGNKWFKPEFKERFPNREQQRRDAISFFMALVNAPIERIAIENPIGIMSTLYRKPAQIIQPFYFGHVEAKATCLWLKNLPQLRYGPLSAQPSMFEADPTPTEIVGPEYTTFKSGKRMATWYATARGASRAKVRSKTFAGIAEAMAEQWGSL